MMSSALRQVGVEIKSKHSTCTVRVNVYSVNGSVDSLSGFHFKLDPLYTK
jgi:hypothetical protein